MDSTVKRHGGRGDRRNQCSMRDGEARAHEDGKVVQSHRFACVILTCTAHTADGSSSRDASSTPWGAGCNDVSQLSHCSSGAICAAVLACTALNSNTPLA